MGIQELTGKDLQHKQAGMESEFIYYKGILFLCQRATKQKKENQITKGEKKGGN